MNELKNKNGGVIRALVAIALFVAVVIVAVVLFFHFRTRRIEETVSIDYISDKLTKENEPIENTGEVAADDTKAAEVTQQQNQEEGKNHQEDQVVLIEGNDKSSNPFERADKLSYTDKITYTQEQLGQLDSYGLRITRNEIYARHGRMFLDKNLQNYFNRQSWYEPTISPEQFDDKVLNKVEVANIKLIVKLETEY